VKGENEVDKILYFPSISIPKSKWLMGALFYWDKVGSIVPLDFLDRPHMLDKHMRELVEAGLIEQVVPEQYLGSIPNFERAFLDFIDNNPIFSHISELGKLGLIGRQNGVIRTTYKIHMGKLDNIGYELMQRGLATRGRGPWYVVEGFTASNFMAYLASVLGAVTDYIPITDSYNELSYFLPNVKKQNIRIALKEQLKARIIEKILPIPSSVEDPYDIYRFKEKYYDNLKRFRNYVEEFVLSLENLPEYQIEEKIKLFTEQANDEIQFISDRMQSFKWRMLDFATFCSISSTAIALAKGVAEKNLLDAISATVGLLGAFGAAFGKEKLMEIERKPLAYAAIVERQFSRSPSNIHAKLSY
jgi:hypothetical protein